MTTITTARPTIQRPEPEYLVDDAQLAAAAFLARYSGRTLDAYRHDLRGYFQWAADNQVPVLEATRPHVELYRSWMDQRGLALLVEAETAAGRLDEARTLCQQLAAIATDPPTPMLRGFAEYAAGLVAIRTSDDGAVRHLETALTAFGEAGLPLEAARARLKLARLLTSTSPEVARAEAKAALTMFDRLGARRDADAAASLLRTLGARGRTGPKHVDVLSQREQEVLQLLGLGLSNPEIAARLYISPKTASHHVSNVLTKLGLRNRAEAAAFASATPPSRTNH